MLNELIEEYNVREYADILHAAAMSAYLRSALAVSKKAARAATVALALGASSGAMNLAAGDVFDTQGAAKVLEQKALLTKFEYDRLDAGYKRANFTVAWVDSHKLLGAVRDRLAEAMREGQTFEQWRTSVDDAFDAQGLTLATGQKRLAGWHLHTIFETNVMSAYSAANWDMLHHPDVKGLFKYFRVNTVGDNRRSPICDQLEGITLPVDHPFWLTHWNPFHYRCRTTIEAIDFEEAARLGITESLPSPAVPDRLPNGFGQSHGAAGHWKAVDDVARKAGTPEPPRSAPRTRAKPDSVPETAAPSAPVAQPVRPVASYQSVAIRGEQYIQPLRTTTKGVFESLAEPVRGDGVRVTFEAMTDRQMARITQPLQEAYDLLSPKFRKKLPDLKVVFAPQKNPGYKNNTIYLPEIYRYMPESQLRLTLFHEFGHHVQERMRFSATSAESLIEQFWEKRTRGERVGPLRGYEKEYPEVKGKNDRWADNYFGRVYDDPLDKAEGSGKEIIAQGMREFFTSKQAFNKLWRQDPETANLLVGVLKGLAG